MAEYEKIVRKVLDDHDCFFVRHGKGDHDICIVRFPVGILRLTAK